MTKTQKKVVKKKSSTDRYQRLRAVKRQKANEASGSSKFKGRKYQVGNEPIFEQQDSAAQEVMSILSANEKKTTPHKRSPIVAGQPQFGKTGIIIAILDNFIRDCEKKGRTFQIIVLTGLPHNDLTEQTRKRLRCSVNGRQRLGADLDVAVRATHLAMYPTAEQNFDGVLILNNTQMLKRLDLTCDVDVRLWVVDEIHLGNVKDGNFDSLWRAHGVKINEQIHTWDNDRTLNHFVGVSATPYAHMLKSDNMDSLDTDSLDGDALFRWVYREPPATYNSMAKMLAKGRLIQTEELVLDNGEPSTFFERVLKRFHQDCKSQGPGYLVIRAVGGRHNQLVHFINRRGSTIECKQFDTHAKNLDELNNYLSMKPKTPGIVLIRGSMRAGITLSKDHFIRGWVETESVSSDTQAQAGVGRACGYGREKDVYPIYCDLSHVKACIEAYDALNKAVNAPCIPSGAQNRGMKKDRVYQVKAVLPGGEEGYKKAWAKYVKPFTQYGSRKPTKSGEHVGKPPTKSGYRKQISRTTGNVFNDVSAFLMAGKRDSGSTEGYYVDGAPTKEAVHKFIRKHLGKGIHKNLTVAEVWRWHKRNLASYNKLCETHPEWVGKIIILDVSKTVQTVSKGQSRDGLQKAKSATKGK